MQLSPNAAGVQQPVIPLDQSDAEYAAFLESLAVEIGSDCCVHCGARYDGGHRCGSCGHGDPLDTGEFDSVTGDELA